LHRIDAGQGPGRAGAGFGRVRAHGQDGGHGEWPTKMMGPEMLCRKSVRNAES
jgi:hypothetical protein